MSKVSSLVFRITNIFGKVLGNMNDWERYSKTYRDGNNNLMFFGKMLFNLIMFISIMINFVYLSDYMFILFSGLILFLVHKNKIEGSKVSNGLLFNKLMCVFIFIIVLVLLFSSNVLAFGITPGRTTFSFEPGLKETISFTVINSEHKDINVVILVQGELNKSIAVSEVSFAMSSDENRRTLQYTLTMPQSLEPGLHTGEVVAIQLPEKSGVGEAFVGSATGVATQVHVYVPFPGKYAEADLNVVGPNDEGEVIFVVPVTNRGDLGLARVRGTVDIFSSLNQKITSVTTNEISLNSQERSEIIGNWDASNAAPGAYRAVATVIYDENTVTVEKEFNVGQRLLELQQVEVNDFTLGEIAKFELLVDNKWSQVIAGAYAQMLIYNNEGEVMADFKSATYDIPPLEKILMVAFWDTAGVSTGTYDSSVFLRYGQESAQQDFRLEVKENEINVVGLGYVISASPEEEGNTLIIVLVTGIVVLILINVLWFLVLRKKLKKK